MTDWNLGKRGDVTKIALARRIGLDGIQVSLIFPTDSTPHLRNPKVQAQFKQAALDNGIQICSLAAARQGVSGDRLSRMVRAGDRGAFDVIADTRANVEYVRATFNMPAA